MRTSHSFGTFFGSAKKGAVKTNSFSGPFHRKGIGAVIATSLLLVVAVAAIVGFQSWYQDFSSGTLSDVDMKSKDATSNTLSIETLVGNTLYVKNSIVDNLSIQSLSIGGIDCNITGQENLSLSINQIDISTCLENVSTSTPDITLITDKKVSNKKIYLKNLEVSIVTDGGVSSTSLSCTTDSDGDGHISWTCAQYPMTETTFEGQLDLDDTNSTIQVTDYCWLKGDKSSCESNFVVDGCGTGTVFDMGTGLCWQRDMSTAGTMTWSNAFSYCSGLSLGDHTDWYLPSREELMSIVDLSRSSPAIIGGNNNKFISVQISIYWTASTYGPIFDYAWNVGFASGGVGNGYYKTDTLWVTCTRRD